MNSFTFADQSLKIWAKITPEGKFILNLPPINSLGWILIAVGAGIICTGIYLVVLTSKGIHI